MYRSPGAEFILRKKLSDAGIGDWEVDSAGTLELGRIPRPEDFGRILSEHGYDFGGRTKHVYSAEAEKGRPYTCDGAAASVCSSGYSAGGSLGQNPNIHVLLLRKPGHVDGPQRLFQRRPLPGDAGYSGKGMRHNY